MYKYIVTKRVTDNCPQGRAAIHWQTFEVAQVLERSVKGVPTLRTQGQYVRQNCYPELFRCIKFRYGLPDAITFRVPNLQ